tara:strand:+ start:15212 stop:15370 length:159 start_codon:yes stop_codon:yes gene_type:complete
MGRIKKRYFICIKDTNIGVNNDGTYKKKYKKGEKILVPLRLIELYKELNIIR